MGKYCYVASTVLGGARRGGGGEGRGHIVSPRAQLVIITLGGLDTLNVKMILTGSSVV